MAVQNRSLPLGHDRKETPIFSHVMIGADDVDASKRFFYAALGTLGVPPGRKDEKGRVFYMTRTGVFALTKPINGSGRRAGTEARWGLPLCLKKRQTRGTRLAWRTVGQRSRSLPVLGRAPLESSTLPTSETLLEIRSVPCTA